MHFQELTRARGGGRFSSFAEVLHAKSLIERCDAVQGMRRLAQYHARLALDALERLPDSVAPPSLSLFLRLPVLQKMRVLIRTVGTVGIVR